MMKHFMLDATRLLSWGGAYCLLVTTCPPLIRETTEGLQHKRRRRRRQAGWHRGYWWARDDPFGNVITGEMGHRHIRLTKSFVWCVFNPH